MTHFPDIVEQIAFEREAIACGLKRLKDNTKNLEDKSYASATVYGVSSMDTLLPLLVNKIENTYLRIRKGKAGTHFADIKQYLIDVEPLAAATITCKISFDHIFSTKPKQDYATYITKAIGNALEDECQMRHYVEHAPGLLKVLQDNYWHKSTGTAWKVKNIQTLMNRYEVKPWKSWGNALRVRLGTWLLECLLSVSGWFEKTYIRQGRKQTLKITPTDQFLAIKDQIMAEAELFSPCAWPMLVEPNDWEPDKQGGYILNELMHAHDFVRRSNQGFIQGKQTYEFINKVQKVAFKLNPCIVKVSEELDRLQRPVGKFLPIVNHELPPKPVDIATNEEARHKYRRDAAEVNNRNAQEFKKSCRTRMTMEAINRFKDKKKFFIPFSYDYRGRIYPIPSVLTPQDTDWGKSLLVFADAVPITERGEYFLRFQIATTYGLDKDTYEDRQKWIDENLDLIKRVAVDPIENIGDWEVAEEPFQFLAACEEYYHVCLKKTRSTTCLPVAIDATCSGLQLLALLAQDASTAKLVNVTKSDKPQDAYKVVAELSKPNIPERYRHIWNRKKTKRTVMTIPYNAKPFSNRAYIKQAFKEDNIELDKDELTEIVVAVRDAMNKVVPGAMQVMKWIELEISKAIKRGEKEIEWTTPSGFVVRQKLMKKEVQRLQLHLLGACELYVATGDKDKPDIARHKAATAPNLIHSLDASLLCLSTLKFNTPIALIHDSVLCRATDMDEISLVVREIYKHLFEQEPLLTFAKQINAETKPPIIGDLTSDAVIDSPYFFC